MKFIQLAIMTVALATSISTRAEFVSGNQLLKWLESSDSSENSLGLGYVAGVFDAQSGVTICAPTTVSVKQVVDATIVFLHTVPEFRNKSADRFVLAAASSRWKCPVKKGASNV